MARDSNAQPFNTHRLVRLTSLSEVLASFFLITVRPQLRISAQRLLLLLYGFPAYKPRAYVSTRVAIHLLDLLTSSLKRVRLIGLFGGCALRKEIQRMS